ncbi:MAG: gliding motility-associated C-terminal domain-containing protein [Bacteroidia bacterium]|nr:gliding motility-associated C-terminal domain-containing protein [Bacteroidia bacterium]
MKKNCCNIIFILCLVFSITNKQAKAQQVLNGSFEDNNLPNNYNFGYGKIGSYIKNYIRNVEYKVADTNILGNGFMLNLPLDSIWLDTVVSRSKYNVKYPPQGKVYICIEDPFMEKPQQVMFLLSDSLKKGKRYTVRFFAGNCYTDKMSLFQIMVALSKNNNKAQTEIDSFYIKDITGYREYVTSFIADDTYKYIDLYLVKGGNIFGGSTRTMIDNIRLDTCVNILPTHYIGCANIPEVLKPTAIGNKYYWNTGDTTPTISVVKMGNYRSYTYDSIGCVNVDSFVVSFFETPGSITNIQLCSGTTQTLKATPAKDVVDFKWNTGDTTASISVNKGGTYWVNRGPIYCFITDSFYVNEIISPSTKNIDTVFCTNSPIIIGKTDAQNYVWNTTEQTPQISINKPGLYWVIKTNPPCENIDTFNITENPLPVIKSLHDTIVCFDQVAKILLDAGKFKSYLWKPTNETSQIIYSSNAQTYLLQVTDNNDCTMSKQITVTENCPQQLFIPNAFSPNGDGINDVFIITTTGLESFEMTIFNRWGEQVFNSQNYLQGWDGKNAPNEVYVVQVTYKLKGKPSETVTQNVTLLR